MLTKENQLAKYRKLWIEKPHLRDVILLQVEMLDWKPRDYTTPTQKQEKRLVQDALDTLFK